MQYYLYRITNLINNKIYVGVHSTDNLEDGYMGSGTIIKSAIKKHGVENFTKEILEFFNSVEEMFNREKELVTPEFVLREDTYNLMVGGQGGLHTDEIICRIKQTLKDKKIGHGSSNTQFGKMWITDGTQNLKILKTEAVPRGWHPGRTMPDGWGDNVRNKLKDRTHIEMLGEEKAAQLSELKRQRFIGNRIAKRD